MADIMKKEAITTTQVYCETLKKVYGRPLRMKGMEC
jgi:hypothetical protein